MASHFAKTSQQSFIALKCQKQKEKLGYVTRISNCEIYDGIKQAIITHGKFNVGTGTLFPTRSYVVLEVNVEVLNMATLIWVLSSFPQKLP